MPSRRGLFWTIKDANDAAKALRKKYPDHNFLAQPEKVTVYRVASIPRPKILRESVERRAANKRAYRQRMGIAR